MHVSKMVLKENEAKGNSVTTDWKYIDFFKGSNKMHIGKLIAIYD